MIAGAGGRQVHQAGVFRFGHEILPLLQLFVARRDEAAIPGPEAYFDAPLTPVQKHRAGAAAGGRVDAGWLVKGTGIVPSGAVPSLG